MLWHQPQEMPGPRRLNSSDPGQLHLAQRGDQRGDSGQGRIWAAGLGEPWGLEGAEVGGLLGCGRARVGFQGSPCSRPPPSPCFPQLRRHLKSSLRTLFRHVFPKGEWAPAWAQGMWACPLSSIPASILSPSGTQALSHLAFPRRQASQLCRQPSHVHALLRGS